MTEQEPIPEPTYAGMLSREDILFTFPREMTAKGSHVLEDMLNSWELMQNISLTDTVCLPVIKVDGNGKCVETAMSSLIYKNEYPRRKPLEPPIRTYERFITSEQLPEAIQFARTYAT